MRRAVVSAFVGLIAFGVSMTAPAQNNSTVSGNVINFLTGSTIQASQPEGIAFQIANMPNTGCTNGGWFVINPTAVPDANTRKNLVATLLGAKLAGVSVNVVYNSTVCDSTSGYAIPIAIIIP
jgi:hypothetical protein